MADLNEKQKRFCEEYLIDLNATQAAIRAGYSIDQIPTKRFYVYYLEDPRNGLIFYFGKGTGDRKDHHVKEVLNCKVSYNPTKAIKIQEIIKSGESVKSIIFHQTNDESEAFSIEAQLIAKFKDKGLLNISKGCKSSIEKDREYAVFLLSKVVPFEQVKCPNKETEEAYIRVFGSLRKAYDYIVNGLKELAA